MNRWTAIGAGPDITLGDGTLAEAKFEALGSDFGVVTVDVDGNLEGRTFTSRADAQAAFNAISHTPETGSLAGHPVRFVGLYDKTDTQATRDNLSVGTPQFQIDATEFKKTRKVGVAVRGPFAAITAVAAAAVAAILSARRTSEPSRESAASLSASSTASPATPPRSSRSARARRSTGVNGGTRTPAASRGCRCT